MQYVDRFCGSIEGEHPPIVVASRARRSRIVKVTKKEGFLIVGSCTISAKHNIILDIGTILPRSPPNIANKRNVITKSKVSRHPH
jgi:hypothetical protein